MGPRTEWEKHYFLHAHSLPEHYESHFPSLWSFLDSLQRVIIARNTLFYNERTAVLGVREKPLSLVYVWQVVQVTLVSFSSGKG